MNWGAAAYPIASISAGGLVTPASVYTDTTGAVSGYYRGASNSTSLLVIDSNPDNFGTYASDSIPDSWQVQYFGLNNPNGLASADADGTGQNNLFKYVAGLNPTNPASIFILKIANVNRQPNQKNLIYSPIVGGRTYTVQFRTNLTGVSGPQTNASQATVTDRNAASPQKFYRIDISLP